MEDDADLLAEQRAYHRARVGRDDVTYVVADVFDWRPEQRYDVVFFSFWLSHVPRARFGEFWSLVRDCLAPGGRAFLVDNREDPEPASPSEAEGWRAQVEGTRWFVYGAAEPAR